MHKQPYTNDYEHPDEIARMDADIADALATESKPDTSNIPTIKMLTAIDAKIRRRSRLVTAAWFAAAILPLITVCTWLAAALYGWGVPPELRTIDVPAGEHLQVLLCDGSSVTLNAESRLVYPERFSRHSREVRLERGEGFFDIRHNPSAPFTVQSQGIAVEVLGTQFNINTYGENNTTTIYLKEGAVRLTEQVSGKEHTYLMKPLDVLSVNRDSGECFTRKQIKPTDAEGWLRHNYKFANAPLDDVISFLNRHYAVTIHVNDKQLYQYTYTMEFRNEPIDEVLSVMSLITPIRYTRINGDITIYSKQ